MKQRTKEWFEMRSGKITASRLGDVIAAPTTKRYNYYLQEIAAELSGAPIMEDDKPWFKHGTKLEPIAKERYEFELFLRGEDIKVDEIGFIQHQDYDFIGASPDGEVGNGCLEIKCSESHDNFSLLCKKDLPPSHKPQVQGQMWIGGYASCDFVLFFRDPDGRIEDEIKISTIYPDIEYHNMLEKKCLDFYEKAKKMAECFELEDDPDGNWLEGI